MWLFDINRFEILERSELITMVKQYALSTIDNPFNPFEDFTSWFMFDIEKGYYSCSRLARFANISDDLTQNEIQREVERAIDDIIFNDIFNVYIKVENKSLKQDT